MSEIVLGEITVISGAISTVERKQRMVSTSPGMPRVEVLPLPLDEARALAEFSIRLPSHYPTPGMTLTRVEVAVAVTSDERRAFATLLRYQDSAAHWMVLQQSRIYGPSRHTVPAAAEPGRIGDRPGAFYTYLVPASSLPAKQLSIARCLWERDGFLLDLQVPNLTKEELARVGESVG